MKASSVMKNIGNQEDGERVGRNILRHGLSPPTPLTEASITLVNTNKPSGKVGWRERGEMTITFVIKINRK